MRLLLVAVLLVGGCSSTPTASECDWSHPIRADGCPCLPEPGDPCTHDCAYTEVEYVCRGDAGLECAGAAAICGRPPDLAAGPVDAAPTD